MAASPMDDRTPADVGADPPRAAAPDFASARRKFLITRTRAYLNNASIAPVSDPVFDAVTGFLQEVRELGRNNYPQWLDHAEHTIKGNVGRLIGAKPGELAFVKNTTEGLVNVANGLNWRDGDNVVLPSIEYSSNVYCWIRLASRGVAVRWVTPTDGRIDVGAIANAIDSRTRLVSVSAVQFSNGYRHDLAGLSELCRSRRILLNLDVIQWAGSLALDLGRLHVDFASFGGHKWVLAPIGTGIFYCAERSLEALFPPTVGFHTVAKSEAHMDYDLTHLRPGAARFEAALENFPGLWGLDAAVRLQLALGSGNIERHILALTERAAEGIRHKGWTVASSMVPAERSGLLSFFAPGIDADTTAMNLRAAGVDVAVRAGRLRMSPSFYNDESDIDRMLAELPRATGTARPQA